MPKSPARKGSNPAGRSNQRQRTRKDLLDAASRLMRTGEKPSLEAVAEEALVSRATAYRYFASTDELLVEAALHMRMPDLTAVFPPGPPEDPATRVGRIDAAFDAMMAANEATLRLMLASALQRGREGPNDPPRRQNRRTPMIEAALEPWREQFDPAALTQLTRALALVIGPESLIAFKDVMALDDAEAKAVKAWMVGALIKAAQKRA